MYSGNVLSLFFSFIYLFIGIILIKHARRALIGDMIIILHCNYSLPLRIGKTLLESWSCWWSTLPSPSSKKTMQETRRRLLWPNWRQKPRLDFYWTHKRIHCLLIECCIRKWLLEGRKWFFWLHVDDFRPHFYWEETLRNIFCKWETIVYACLISGSSRWPVEWTGCINIGSWRYHQYQVGWYCSCGCKAFGGRSIKDWSGIYELGNYILNLV